MANVVDKIPQLFKGQTVYVLGGGPSLRELQDSDLLKGRATLAVNNALYLGNWVSTLFFGDAKWYWWNKDRVTQYAGPKYSLNIVVEGRDKSVVDEPDIQLIRKARTFGCSSDPGGIGWNRSSGAGAIDLARMMGASRVVLLGFDMRRVNDEKNYRKHENDGKTNPNPWPCFIAGFEKLATATNAIGFEVLNATPETALECFPKINLTDALAQFPL